MLDRETTFATATATLVEQCKVRILDVASEAEETLEFKDRVVAMNLSDTHLIICSPNQCYVYARAARAPQQHSSHGPPLSYSLRALNTPIIIDIKEPPLHVQQSEKYAPPLPAQISCSVSLLPPPLTECFTFCSRYFILVDPSGMTPNIITGLGFCDVAGTTGISVFNLDGRPLPPPKIAAMRADLLDRKFIR